MEKKYNQLGYLAYLQEDLKSIEFLRSVTIIKPDNNKVAAEYLYQYLLAAVPFYHRIESVRRESQELQKMYHLLIDILIFD